ncbi:MAG: hypothetical protein RH946_00660 [Rhodospirillales bacterium]
MTGLSPSAFTIWRCNCSLHAHKRAGQRGVPLSHNDIEVLNRWIDRARPAFEKPGQFRYRIGVHRANGDRFRVIYDTQLQTVVTIHTGRMKFYDMER